MYIYTDCVSRLSRLCTITVSFSILDSTLGPGLELRLRLRSRLIGIYCTGGKRSFKGEARMGCEAVPPLGDADSPEADNTFCKNMLFLTGIKMHASLHESVQLARKKNNLESENWHSKQTIIPGPSLIYCLSRRRPSNGRTNSVCSLSVPSSAASSCSASWCRRSEQ